MKKKFVTNEDARKQAILHRLANNKPSKWNLERAIWRAGELKIREATPLLIKLIYTGEPLRDYCIAWALGWCGDNDAVPRLTDLYQNPSTPEFVQRIAFEALLKLSDAETQAALQTTQIELLPPELRNLASSTSVEAFEEFAAARPSYLFAFLDKIYQIDNKFLRPAILQILRTAPFQPNYFRPLRHIFKIAEYRRDAEVFAILAYRFEREIGQFNNDLTDLLWNEVTGKYHSSGKRVYTEELQHPEPILAYSNQTQEYLRRRVWRTLKKLGEQGDRDYTKMATAILIQYSDADEPPLRRSKFDKWDKYTRTVNRFWDRYADYLTFNHILYTNSQRYIYYSNGWCRRKSYESGEIEPKMREEAFPELWEQNPEALLQLLLESECLPVHYFAVKALRVHQSFCDRLDINTIVQLVNKPYETTAGFGFELALRSYNPTSPDRDLTLILANRFLQVVSEEKYQWVTDERHQIFLKNSGLIATLATSPDTQIRSVTCKFISSYILSETTAKLLFERLLAELLSLPETEPDLAKDIADTLVVNFTPQLLQLELNVILGLLAHPTLEIQELGALIVIQNHKNNLTPQLSSLYDLVQLIAIQRYGELHNTKLISQERHLILQIAVSPILEIRNAIKPIIRRLVKAYPEFNLQLALDFIEILLNPENHEGVHCYLVTVLQEDLQEWMTDLYKETAVRLLTANSSAAQEIGGLMLGANYQIWTSELTTDEILILANHQVYSIREAAQQMFLQNLERNRRSSQEMLAYVDLLDSQWSDSREFAHKVLTAKFHLEEFTPKILASICDRKDEDARKLGRDLLTRYIPEIRRLSLDNSAFATQILSEFVEILLTSRKHEGWLSYLVRLLWENLAEWMAGVNKQTALKLLQSQSLAGQELGGLLLSANSQAWTSEFTTSEIVSLANHDILSVRVAARQMFLQILERVRSRSGSFAASHGSAAVPGLSHSQEMLTAVRLLDAERVDSWDFAFRIFTQELKVEDLTPKALVCICDSTNKDARTLGKDLIARYFHKVRHLATDNPTVNLQIASDFIKALLAPEKHEGVYSYIVHLLKEELDGWMTSINRETVINLLAAKSSVIQELGGLLLTANFQDFSREFSTCEIVKLANHEIVSVRKAALQMFSQVLERVRSHSEEMLAAVKMLESKWEDSREFAFKIFTTKFSAREFTPQVLVSICDSVREDVRRLGRDLLTRNFQTANREDYLLKFSEHPSADMQRYVTNFLEKYVINQPQHLRELTPYFITVLSAVNRGRVAKQRIFHFLESEAQKTEEAARIVAEIMTRHSGTMAIGDKAKAIQIMLKINKKYPYLSLPIEVKPVSRVRS
ncbi:MULTISPECIES: HEAT repeat domain-containing protein [Nostocales]|uniref:HEAT repeat domain-containing protein n=2 Tax=Nostocales TaxID=1161 RepID=A0ABW8WRH0_9CYAN|nr:HEAT repeat domain-containing protein [Tolypothrix bouteillei]